MALKVIQLYITLSLPSVMMKMCHIGNCVEVMCVFILLSSSTFDLKMPNGIITRWSGMSLFISCLKTTHAVHPVRQLSVQPTGPSTVE